MCQEGRAELGGLHGLGGESLRVEAFLTWLVSALSLF
jgi:hypothetical protein